jgi:hypothetical protein
MLGIFGGGSMKKISFFILIIFSLVLPLTGYATPLTEAVEKGSIGVVLEQSLNFLTKV